MSALPRDGKMTTNATNALSELLESFMAESMELRNRVTSNKSRIDEIGYQIENEGKDENAEERIFSPHKESKKAKGLTASEALSREKKRLEEENQAILSELDVLDGHIGNIQEVISAGPLRSRFALLDMQEMERQRIARDLHDTSLQNLTHLIHSIELSSLYIDSDPQRAKLELKSIAKTIRGVINDMRSTIYDLRPMEFDDLGFREAIQNMVGKIQKETSIFLHLYMAEEITIGNNLILSNIYRIVRECLSNAMRHSGASEVNISIYEKDDCFYIEVADNGIGLKEEDMSDDQHHFGLQILEERVQLLGGTLDIGPKREDKKGTVVAITIPIADL
jgi:two-component system sensor histidine kinase DegS